MRIKRRFVLASFIIAGLMVWVAALATLIDQFELGDSSVTPGTADILGEESKAPPGAQSGPDWADIFDTNGNVVSLFGGADAVFLGTNDDSPPRPGDDLAVGGLVDQTIFASTNKNNDLISTWQWDTGNTPVKNDISNAYAYATLENSTDDLLIYVGLERLAPNGASHVDVEINQSEIGLDKDPPCGDDETDGVSDTEPCEFTGEKTVGDILVVMNFENGGALGFFEVRRWTGTEYALRFQKLPPNGGSAEGCNAPPGATDVYSNGVFASDSICMVNNTQPPLLADIQSGPWRSFDSHGNTITTLEDNAFTEMGINITEILGTAPCFNTIQVKTRSSPSFNSELKDFAFGQFDLCGSITIIKEATPENFPVGSPQVFDYSGSLGAFTLVDDGSGGNRITFNDLLEDIYDVTEGVPSGWDLDNLTCIDPSGGTTTNIPSATASIDLLLGEHVECTYENSAEGTIVIIKNSIPDDSQVFDYAGTLATFTLVDDGSPPGNIITFTRLVGTYDVTETVPNGWDLTDLDCVDDLSIIDSSGDKGTGVATINLDLNETVTQEGYCRHS
jgi:hypothetical protein